MAEFRESYSHKQEPLTAQQYLERLPPKVRARLQKYLKGDERLLWAEWTGIKTPGDLWYWLKLGANGFLQGIIWVSLICLALLITGLVSRIDFLVSCGSFFLICLSLLMIILWLAAQGTVYALTDLRAMVVSPVNFTSYSDIDPARFKVVEYAPDLTCFHLNQDKYNTLDGEEREDNFEIYARTDASHLKQLLEDYFSRSSDAALSWPKIETASTDKH